MTRLPLPRTRPLRSCSHRAPAPPPALPARSEFWSEVPPQLELTIPDESGIPRDVDQISRTRMSLVAMLTDAGVTEAMGSERVVRARELVQQLRVTADTIVESKAAGWKFTFCPYLKARRAPRRAARAHTRPPAAPTGG